MSTTESEPGLVIPTLREMRALADGTYMATSGNIAEPNPELIREIAISNANILKQLSGQAKADFFHRYYFDIKGEPGFGNAVYVDTELIWQEMAEQDPEVAGWLASLEAQQKDIGDMKTRIEARDSIVDLAVGRVAVHPSVVDIEGGGRSKIAGFQGTYEEYEGADVVVVVAVPPRAEPGEDSYAWIDIFHEPVPVKEETYRASSMRRPNDRDSKKVVMQHLEEGTGLVKTGDRFMLRNNYDTLQNDRYEIIDRAGESDAVARHIRKDHSDPDKAIQDLLPLVHIAEAGIVKPGIKELRALQGLLKDAVEIELPDIA